MCHKWWIEECVVGSTFCAEMDRFGMGKMETASMTAESAVK